MLVLSVCFQRQQARWHSVSFAPYRWRTPGGGGVLPFQAQSSLLTLFLWFLFFSTHSVPVGLLHLLWLCIRVDGKWLTKQTFPFSRIEIYCRCLLLFKRDYKIAVTVSQLVVAVSDKAKTTRWSLKIKGRKAGASLGKIGKKFFTQKSCRISCFRVRFSAKGDCHFENRKYDSADELSCSSSSNSTAAATFVSLKL